MRVLWIRRGASCVDAGDSIYDDKLQRALANRFAITNCLLTRNPRQRQLMGAGLSLSLPEQFGSGTLEDDVRVRAMLPAHDVAIFSHEHLDRFARAMRPHTNIPFISLRHNVTSDAMASVLSANALMANLYHTMATLQERATLRGPLYQAVTAISARDLTLLTALSGRNDVALVMPGAPPAAPLAPHADVRRELVVSGTYDWFPKTRDVHRFAEEYSAAPAPDSRVYLGAGVPHALRATLGGADEHSLDYSAAIRFGVITDRFTAGHKLKTAAHLMNNCAVISFARVSEDFAGFPHAKRWIFEIRDVAEIGPIMDHITSLSATAARAELIALKRAVDETLSWKVQAEALATVIDTAFLKRDARPEAYTG
jgi:hypothetical protein